MRPEYSEGTYRVLSDAQKAAGKYRHRFVHTEYLLLGLLQTSNSATKLLESLDFSVNRLRADCKRQCQVGKHAGESSLKLTPRVQAILTLAGEEMEALGHSRLESRHLLLGMLREEEGVAGHVLRDAGVELAALRETLRGGGSPSARTRTAGRPAEPEKSSGNPATLFLKRIWGRT